MSKKMTFLKASMDFFGLHADQTPMQFGKELLALTPEDKAEIRAGLEQNGYEITLSAAGN